MIGTRCTGRVASLAAVENIVGAAVDASVYISPMMNPSLGDRLVHKRPTKQDNCDALKPYRPWLDELTQDRIMSGDIVNEAMYGGVSTFSSG